MIVTGPVMSPALVGRFPWYAKMFGGRQAARSLHLIGMFIYLGFAIVHVGLVFIVHAPPQPHPTSSSATTTPTAWVRPTSP